MGDPDQKSPVALVAIRENQGLSTVNQGIFTKKCVIHSGKSLVFANRDLRHWGFLIWITHGPPKCIESD